MLLCGKALYAQMIKILCVVLLTLFAATVCNTGAEINIERMKGAFFFCSKWLRCKVATEAENFRNYVKEMWEICNFLSSPYFKCAAIACPLQ